MNDRLRRDLLKSSAETIDLLIQATRSRRTPIDIRIQAEDIELTLQDLRQNLHKLVHESLQ